MGQHLQAHCTGVAEWMFILTFRVTLGSEDLQGDRVFQVVL